MFLKTFQAIFVLPFGLGTGHFRSVLPFWSFLGEFEKRFSQEGSERKMYVDLSKETFCLCGEKIWFRAETKKALFEL